MGSFLAGMKAGTLSGVLYLGGLAIFNVVLLYALKPDVMAAIQSQYSQICAPVGGNATSTVEDCFASVVAVDVPYVAFVGFFISLLYSGLFGLYYEGFPGKKPVYKGEMIAVVVGLNLVILGFSGFYFDLTSALATGTFFLVWSGVFGYFLGRLYRKYTGTIEFQSSDPESLRIVVGRSDFTGKARTFAISSSQRLRAQVADDASFKEWAATGEVTIEDNRSFETVMEVNGDGQVAARVAKKY